MCAPSSLKWSCARSRRTEIGEIGRGAERCDSSIKKSRLHRRDGLSQDQRRSLADTVGALQQQLATGQVKPQTQFIPQELVDRLNERHRPRMAYFLEDLSRAVSVLRDDLVPLDDSVVGVLDEVCDAADETASAVFRRMRRR